MNIVVRLLLGIPITAIVGWITYMISGLLELLINGSALAAAKGIRRSLGMRSTNERLGGIAASIVVVAKGIYGACLGLSILIYGFLYPTWESVSTGLLVAALVTLIVLWAPALFFLSLFVSFGREDPAVSEADLGTYMAELTAEGVTGERFYELANDYRMSGRKPDPAAAPTES